MGGGGRQAPIYNAKTDCIAVVKAMGGIMKREHKSIAKLFRGDLEEGPH